MVRLDSKWVPSSQLGFHFCKNSFRILFRSCRFPDLSNPAHTPNWAAGTHLSCPFCRGRCHNCVVVLSDWCRRITVDVYDCDDSVRNRFDSNPRLHRPEQIDDDQNHAGFIGLMDRQQGNERNRSKREHPRHVSRDNDNADLEDAESNDWAHQKERKQVRNQARIVGPESVQLIAPSNCGTRRSRKMRSGKRMTIPERSRQPKTKALSEHPSCRTTRTE